MDLGAGPCPSTGLDQMKFDYELANEYFHVLAPGTYCVSLSKNQSVTQNGAPFYPDLNNGIWTDPFTTDLVTSKTVTLGPGNQDVILEFGWDEYEQTMLWYPMPEQTWCRIGPDPICDPLGVIGMGEMLPLMARDRNTEWKMTSYGGESCFVYLPAVQVDQALAEIPGNLLFTEDLPFFDPQPPCPEPEPELACADIKNQTTCKESGCKWVVPEARVGAATMSYCTDK